MLQLSVTYKWQGREISLQYPSLWGPRVPPPYSLLIFPRSCRNTPPLLRMVLAASEWPERYRLARGWSDVCGNSTGVGPLGGAKLDCTAAFRRPEYDTQPAHGNSKNILAPNRHIRNVASNLLISSQPGLQPPPAVSNVLGSAQPLSRLPATSAPVPNHAPLPNRLTGPTYYESPKEGAAAVAKNSSARHFRCFRHSNSLEVWGPARTHFSFNSISAENIANSNEIIYLVFYLLS